MKINKLKVGYPFYHVVGTGAYMGKDEIIYEFVLLKGNAVDIVTVSKQDGENHFGHHYVTDEDEIEILFNEAYPAWNKMLLIELKAWWFRNFVK